MQTQEKIIIITQQHIIIKPAPKKTKLTIKNIVLRFKNHFKNILTF